MENKDKKPKYRDIHGTTRVGDFLRTIGKSEVLDKILGVGGELLTGDIKGAIDVLKNSNKLTPEQLQYAIKMAEFDIIDSQEITKRWSADMASDSWLSKNIRPLVLGYLILTLTIFIILDASVAKFEVKAHWVTLLSGLLMTTVGAYFGIRGIEKIYKIKK